MKKSIMWLLSIILCLILGLSSIIMVSCRSISSTRGFYTKTTLRKLHLDGLKKPKYTYKGKEDWFRSIYGYIEKEEFERYANEVFEFLTDKYEYVGTGGCITSDENSATPGRLDYIQCDLALENYRFEDRLDIKYIFAFFEDTPKYEDRTKNQIILIYRKTPNINLNFSMYLKSQFTLDYSYDGYFYYGKNFIKENITAQYIKAVDLERRLPHAIFTSKEKIAEYFEIYQESLFKETALTEALKKYNEEYFENKCLAICSHFIDEGQEVEIKSYQFERIMGKNFIIKLKYLEEAEEAEKQKIYIVLEVDKGMIADSLNEEIAVYPAT